MAFVKLDVAGPLGLESLCQRLNCQRSPVTAATGPFGCGMALGWNVMLISPAKLAA